MLRTLGFLLTVGLVITAAALTGSTEVYFFVYLGLVVLGAIAGLATITPCAGFVRPWAAFVVGILAAAENMPSHKAYRPSDIIRSASGQTIEIVNTDADNQYDASNIGDLTAPVVAGVALLLVFGRRGVLGAPLAEAGVTLAFTTTAVVLAQVFVASPFYVRAMKVGCTYTP